MTKTDNDFNIIDEEELFMGTAFASQEIIYNDAIRENPIRLCTFTAQKQKKSVHFQFLSIGFTETISQLVRLNFSFSELTITY